MPIPFEHWPFVREKQKACFSLTKGQCSNGCTILSNARNVRLYSIRISSTPTILCFDLYLYSAYAAHYGYINTLFVPSLLLVKMDVPLFLPRRYFQFCFLVHNTV